MQLPSTSQYSVSLKHLLSTYLGPFSLLLLLTGLMWLPDHGTFPKLFYPGMLCAVILLAFNPQSFEAFRKEPLFFAIALFILYFIFNGLLLEDGPHSWSVLKRQVEILLLFILVLTLACVNPKLLIRSIFIAMLAAIIFSLSEIYFFAQLGEGNRLSGRGALDNPLMIAHIYGFYAALWLSFLMSGQETREKTLALLALLPLLILIAWTGSRTPILALSITLLWIAMLLHPKKLLWAFFVLVAIFFLVMIFLPDLLLDRGLSYRPQIWADVFRQSQEAIWLGRGPGAQLSIQLPQFDYPFRDPHNMTLSVLYRGGIIGITLWVAMYGFALLTAWRNRTHRQVLMASAVVVYGLMSGMTEGGALFPRPKEHWFLLWIPLALLLSAMADKKKYHDQAA